jgi:hypothetical protein
MKQILNNILASLDNHSKGYSGRKLTAVWSVLVASYVTHRLPEDMRLHALYAWQILALLCLGIVTFEQIIKLKNGGNNEQT